MRNAFAYARYAALRNLKIISFAAAIILFAAQPALAFAQSVPQQTSNAQSQPAFAPASGVGTSANWAGYVAQQEGSTYSSVSGSWVVPTIPATHVSTAADATWVGIGGVQSEDLIQAGTQAVVQNGQVQYEAWYELLPDYQTQLPFSVTAGDPVSVSIAETSPNNWSITFVDGTTGQTYQKTVSYTSSRSSAEWIEEMPVGGTGRVLSYLPLDNFGVATFSNASATVNGVQQNLLQAGAEALRMVAGYQALATPSALGTDGSSFSVARSDTIVAVAQVNQRALPLHQAHLRIRIRQYSIH